MEPNNYVLSEQLLENILDDHRQVAGNGTVASYIPALANKDPQDVGIVVVNSEGTTYAAGDYQIPFTIQSISKVVTLILALMDRGGDTVYGRVGVEPTEDKFNSILPLELSSAYPPNPMINAGAMVVTSLIKGRTSEEKYQRILDLTKKLSGNYHLTRNEDVYISENRSGHKNRSLGYYLKDANVLVGEVEEVLDCYFKHCSISVTAEDLANIALILARDGKNLAGEQIVPKRVCKIVRTVMSMSGLYDESGKFAINVGFPSKSGVGGGIMSIVPGKMGIGFYGPALNEKGSSIVGLNVLADLSNRFELGIY